MAEQSSNDGEPGSREIKTETLTDARVRGAPVTGKRYSINDTKESGLELRVSAKGRKTWALRGSVEGKDVRLLLGLYGPKPLMSLDDARAEAAKAKVRLRQEGDFRYADRKAEADRKALEKAQEEEKRPRRFTVNDLADAWIKPRLMCARARALYKQILDTHVRPHLGGTSLDDVSRADVRDVLAKIAEKHPAPDAPKRVIGGPRVSKAVKQVIGALFEFAQEELERDCRNPVAGRRKKGKRADAQPARDRALNEVEIRRWWAAVNDPDLPPGPASKIALKVALFSAQRAGEIVGMRDSELDFTERTWLVPPERTKSGRGNLVPLTPRLIGLIRQAQALRTPPKDKHGDALPFPPDAPVFGIKRHSLSRGMARLVAKIGPEDDPLRTGDGARSRPQRPHAPCA